MTVALEPMAAVAGDTGRLRTIAGQLDGQADGVNACAAEIGAAREATTGFWQTPAGRAYRSRMEQETAPLRTLAGVVRVVAEACRTLAGTLEAARAKMDGALRGLRAKGIEPSYVVGAVTYDGWSYSFRPGSWSEVSRFIRQNNLPADHFDVEISAAIEAFRTADEARRAFVRTVSDPDRAHRTWGRSIADGVSGSVDKTLQYLGDLAHLNGSDRFEQAWRAQLRLIGASFGPMSQQDAEVVSEGVRDFVASDKWGEDPLRAFSETATNLATGYVATKGLGLATGRIGAAGREVAAGPPTEFFTTDPELPRPANDNFLPGSEPHELAATGTDGTGGFPEPHPFQAIDGGLVDPSAPTMSGGGPGRGSSFTSGDIRRLIEEETNPPGVPDTAKIDGLPIAPKPNPGPVPPELDLGNFAHRYKDRHVEGWPAGTDDEVPIPTRDGGTIRPDGLDRPVKEVLELKPEGSEQFTKAQQQLPGRIQAVQDYLAGQWTGQVLGWNQDAMLSWLIEGEGMTAADAKALLEQYGARF